MVEGLSVKYVCLSVRRVRKFRFKCRRVGKDLKKKPERNMKSDNICFQIIPLIGFSPQNIFSPITWIFASIFDTT